MMNELDFRFNPVAARHIHVSDSDSAYQVMSMILGSSTTYHCKLADDLGPSVCGLWTGSDFSHAIEYTHHIEAVSCDGNSFVIWKDNAITSMHSHIRAMLNIPATVVERVGSLHHVSDE